MSSVALIAIALFAVVFLTTGVVAAARRRRASAPSSLRAAPGGHMPVAPDDDAPLPVLPTHRNAQPSEDDRAPQVPEHLAAPILPPAERRARFVRDAARDGDRVA